MARLYRLPFDPGVQLDLDGEPLPPLDPLPEPPPAPSEPESRATLDLEELHPDGGLRQLPLRLRVADALEAGGEVRKAEKLRTCSSQWFVLACERGHARPICVGCDDRLCPDCAPGLAGRGAAQVRHVMGEARAAGVRVVHAVFTLGTIERLEPGTLQERLHRPLSRLLRQRPVAARLAGAYRCTEVTRRGNGWHAHLHVLLALAPGFVDYGDLGRDLAKRWHGLTGCSPDCPAKLASFDGEDGCSRGGSVWLGDVLNLRDNRPEARAKADDLVEELAKYVTKPVLLEEEDGRVDPRVAELSRAIHGLRLRQGYGVFFGLGRTDPAPATCARCEEHNEHVRRSFDTGEDPGPDRGMLDPDAGYVDTTMRCIGSLDGVWRKAVEGNRLARRAVAWLRRHHPELWGDLSPPNT